MFRNDFARIKGHFQTKSTVFIVLLVSTQCCYATDYLTRFFQEMREDLGFTTVDMIFRETIERGLPTAEEQATALWIFERTSKNEERPPGYAAEKANAALTANRKSENYIHLKASTQGCQWDRFPDSTLRKPFIGYNVPKPKSQNEGETLRLQHIGSKSAIVEKGIVAPPVDFQSFFRIPKGLALTLISSVIDADGSINSDTIDYLRNNNGGTLLDGTLSISIFEDEDIEGLETFRVNVRINGGPVRGADNVSVRSIRKFPSVVVDLQGIVGGKTIQIRNRQFQTVTGLGDLLVPRWQEKLTILDGTVTEKKTLEISHIDGAPLENFVPAPLGAPGVASDSLVPAGYTFVDTRLDPPLVVQASISSADIKDEPSVSHSGVMRKASVDDKGKTNGDTKRNLALIALLLVAVFLPAGYILSRNLS